MLKVQMGICLKQVEFSSAGAFFMGNSPSFFG
jgi:hypothetical protein